jgi:hypothetical protein
LVRPKTVAELREQIAQQERKIKAQREAFEEQIVIAQNLSPLARARRGFRQRGGVSGISTAAQQRLELKTRSLLGRLLSGAKGKVKSEIQKKGGIRHLVKKGAHDIYYGNPGPVTGSNFLNMLDKNSKLSKQAKAKAALTFLKRERKTSRK